MTAFRLITFDLDDTLWPVMPVIRRADQAMMSWLGSRLPTPPETMAARLQALRSEVLLARPDIAHDLSALRIAVLTQLLRENGWTPAQADSDAQAAFEVFHAARHDVEPFAGSVETLTALSRRHLIHALSNGNADVRRTPFAHCFHAHFHAGMAGHAKPHPRLFELSLAAAGAAPHEALHIGDHPEQDVQAARAVGMHVLWFNPSGQPWPGEDEEPESVASWQALAARLLPPR